MQSFGLSAMTDKCLHEIKIGNLQNGNVVNHQLLLVKGNVIRRCSLNDIDIRINNSRNQQFHVQTTRVGRGGEFKFLVDLRDHLEVNFTFMYCNSKQNLKIYHEVAGNRFRVQPLYIICQGENGEFSTRQGANGNADTACKLIDLNLLLVQSLYAEKLQENGFDRQSFTLNGQCKIFHSNLTCEQAWNSTEDELWHAFGKEILNSSLGKDSDLKFVAFIACTRYNGAAVAALKDFSYANIKRHLKAHAALGGGGLALFGSGYFYAWPQSFKEIIPCFQDESKVDLVRFPDDSNYRRTHVGVYATSLGAVCHELGHIFDLGHTQDGIMGTGFDYLNLVFTIDNLTEHLPKRQIKGRNPDSSNLAPLNVPRFTQLKKPGGDFMEKYHEQKCGDSFYFSRNCAIVLAHHLWIKKRHNREFDVRCADEHLSFDIITQSVKSEGKDALKLIEIRSSSNSFVDIFYEFSRNACEEPVFQFKLPSCATKLNKTHYIFVITVSGCTKSLYFH